MESKKITFNFYGINVFVSGIDSIVDKITGDFKYFINVNNNPFDIKLEVNFAVPPMKKYRQSALQCIKPIV